MRDYKKRIVAGLEEACGTALHDAGFRTGRSAWRLHRTNATRIDFLEIGFADVEGRAPRGLTPASFGLMAGVFFRGIPHPMEANLDGIAGEPANGVASCHFVFSVRPSWWRAGFQSHMQWYVDAWGVM